MSKTDLKPLGARRHVVLVNGLSADFVNVLAKHVFIMAASILVWYSQIF
jgi:type IV secretory pathway TrbD component